MKNFPNFMLIIPAFLISAAVSCTAEDKSPQTD